MREEKRVKSQAHAASRKWFARALNFLAIRNKFSLATATQYRLRFKRQDKFAAALAVIQASMAVTR